MSDNNIEIAMFGQKHMLSREGGVEIVVKELSKRLAAKGYKVTCYDRSSSHVSGSELDDREEYHDVQIIPVWTFEKKGLAALSSSFSASWKIAHSSANVVHIHAEGSAALCRYLKHKGFRVIVTIHGLDWQRAKWDPVASKYIRFGEKQAVKYADEIIVLSHCAQKYFLDTYGRNTNYIPNGVSKPHLREADKIRELWGLDKNSYVLFSGRIVPEKGIDYLLDAWKGIKTDKTLVIAGGSSDTDKYAASIRSRAGNNVIFTGFQQGDVLEELYSNAYLYVLPSDLEGMPLSLLEAMSFGNCCVVSDIEECTEVVEDKAVVFRRSDVDDLRRTIQELIDDVSRVQAFKDVSSKYICGKYNWDDVADKTLKLYLKR